MRKQTITSILLALAAGAGLGWYMRGTQVDAASNRVFEMRTYTAAEGKLPALVGRFENHTVKLFEKHGIKNIGYWVPQDEPGRNTTLIYFVAHPSREAAAKSWAAFRADPEWNKVRTESEVNGRLATKVESVYLDPTAFSPLK